MNISLNLEDFKKLVFGKIRHDKGSGVNIALHAIGFKAMQECILDAMLVSEMHVITDNTL